MNSLTITTPNPEEVSFKNSPEIKHLLSRALLVPPPEKESVFRGKSRKQVVDILLKYEPVFNSRPIKDYDAVLALQPDVRVGLGKTWIYDLNHDSLINEKRKNSLINWMMSVLSKESPLSLMPRMFLFWSDFFDLKLRRIPFAPKSFRHFDIIRNHALGNFADLLTEVVADPGMIYYFRRLVPGEKKIYEYTTQQLVGRLSGHQFDQSRHSREKLRKLSRVINKWHFICDNADLHFPNLKPMDIYKEENKHYYETYFSRSDAQEVLGELRYLINNILDFQTAVSLSEQLFECFLSKSKNKEYSQRLILPTAEAFFNSNFDISAWLRKFFMNDFFFKSDFKNNLEKKPIDFLFRITHQLEIINLSTIEVENYIYWDWLRHNISQLGQDLFNSEARQDNTKMLNGGNTGWLTSKALHSRYVLVDKLFETGYIFNDKIVVVDILELVKKLSNPSDAMLLIDEAVERFYDIPILVSQKRLLIESCLLDGKKDYAYWTNLWNEAIVSHKSYAITLVSEKLKRLFKFLLIQPEYHYH